MSDKIALTMSGDGCKVLVQKEDIHSVEREDGMTMVTLISRHYPHPGFRYSVSESPERVNELRNSFSA